MPFPIIRPTIVMVRASCHIPFRLVGAEAGLGIKFG